MVSMSDLTPIPYTHALQLLALFGQNDHGGCERKDEDALGQ
jgi:hypothetical protein